MHFGSQWQHPTMAAPVLDDALAEAQHLGQVLLDLAIPGAAMQLVPGEAVGAAA